MATYEYEGTFTQVDGNGNKTKLYPNIKTDDTLSVSGKAADAAAVGTAIEEAMENAGGIPIITTTGTSTAYVATVEGVTSLPIGYKLTIVPHVTSTTTTPTLAFNDVGAKYIRMSSTSNTGSASNGTSASWLLIGKPVTVTWDGTQWKTDIQRPAASSLDGTVTIAKGGTGASTLEAAKENLGIGAKVVPVTQAEYTALGDAVKTDGNIYAITDTETGRYISDVCATITNWNDAITNGWYMGNGASNNPTSSTSGWYFGRVIAHSNKYIYQEVWAFANNASSTVSLPKYIRNCNNGTWSSWYNDTPSKYLTNGGTPYFGGVNIGTSSDSTAYIYSEGNDGNIYFRYTDASGNTRYTNIRDIVAALNI